MATPAAVLSLLVKADGVKATQAQLRQVDDTAKRTHKTFGALGSAAKLAGGVAGVGALTAGINTMLDEYREAQKVGAQTNAVLKSTRGAANISKKGIEDLAGAISKKTGIDDEAIQSSENLLLTFTKVRNETGKGNQIFTQATKVVTDMSVALGQSGKSSAIQLGKALNDPIKGITALRRVGVSFTADQEKQIKTMVQSGNLLGAQKKILAELTTEFGGSAAAQATAGDRLKVSLGNLAEAAGRIVVPALDVVARAMSSVIDAFIEGKGIAGVIVSGFQGIGAAAQTLITDIAALVGWFKQHQTVAMALAAAVTVFAAAYTASLIPALVATTAALYAQVAAWVALRIAFLASPIGLIVTGLSALAAGLVVAYRESETFRNIVNGVFAALKAAATVVFPAIVSAVTSAWNAIRSVTVTVWNGIKTFLTAYFAVLRTIITTWFNIYKAIITTAWNVVRTVTVAVWSAIRTATVAVWSALRTAASAAWGGIRDAILNPIRAARDTLNGIWSGIKGAASAAWSALKSGASDFAGAFKSIIVNAFKGAVDAVFGFIGAIIDVINVLPGVNIKKPANPFAGGDKGGGGGGRPAAATGLARGGAFARTGGMVSSPITLMGEEAPRHPEFVIPTNPAYRGRAQGLLAQAAGAIGFAAGGQYSAGELAALWMRAGGKETNSALMARIAQVESGGWPLRNYGEPPPGTGLAGGDGGRTKAAGLWQILGLPFPGNAYDPLTNARMALSKFNAAGTSPWNASKSKWASAAGGNPSGGVLDKAARLASQALDAIGGSAEALLGKLPGVGDLPDWLQGTGKYVLDHVGKWIKDKVSSIIPGGGGGGGAEGGVGIEGGLKVARAIAAKHYPYSFGGGHNASFAPSGDIRGNGAFGYDCSGYVSAILHGMGVLSSPMAVREPMASALMRGPGKNVTVGIRGSSGLSAHTMIKIGGQYFEAGSGHGASQVGGWSGSFEYFHPGGMRKGGVYGPYMGAYKNGGILPGDGLYYGHKGEAVIPMAVGGAWGPSWYSAPAQHFQSAQPWGHRGSSPGYTPPPPMAAAEPSYSQADIDALNDQINGLNSEVADLKGEIVSLNAQIDLLNATIAILNDLIATQNQRIAELQKNVNVSQGQYATLAKAIADVANGELGGRVGLGFMSPGFAGGGVRY